MNLLLLGAGYSATAVATWASRRGWQVTGTTRSRERMRQLEGHRIRPILYDGTLIMPDLKRALAEATHLLISVPPAGSGVNDPMATLVKKESGRAAPSLRWIGYYSTVGVYGDRGGAWVSEADECRPGPGRSSARLAAEADWRDTGRAAGTPVALLRLAGIYGPGRNALAALAEGTARRIIKEGQVFNRVHAEDIAAATLMLAEQEADGVFNLADGEPAPPQHVVIYAAGLMGIEPPPAVRFDEANLTPIARSFYEENKRVSNARLRGFGYRFLHPDYRAGLRALWESGAWR